MKHTVSYAFFDGVRNAIDNQPNHFEFEATNHTEKRMEVSKIIDTIYDKICEYWQQVKLNNGFEPSNWQGPTCDWYWTDYMKNNKDDIIDCLMDRSYWVWNEYQKWYIIAFSLDYMRFNIFAKDCDKKLIKWRDDDANDPIKLVRKFD